jgi:hypothetical protein
MLDEDDTAAAVICVAFTVCFVVWVVLYSSRTGAVWTTALSNEFRPPKIYDIRAEGQGRTHPEWRDILVGYYCFGLRTVVKSSFRVHVSQPLSVRRVTVSRGEDGQIMIARSPPNVLPRQNTLQHGHLSGTLAEPNSEKFLEVTVLVLLPSPRPRMMLSYSRDLPEYAIGVSHAIPMTVGSGSRRFRRAHVHVCTFFTRRFIVPAGIFICAVSRIRVCAWDLVLRFNTRFPKFCFLSRCSLQLWFPVRRIMVCENFT